MDIQTFITVAGFILLLADRLISAGKILGKVEDIEKNQAHFEAHITAKLLDELEKKYYAPIESLGKRVKDLENQNEKLFGIITGIQTNFGKVMDALRRNQASKKGAK